MTDFFSSVHFGRWQDVLPDCEFDSLITDPPYLGARGESWESNRVPLAVPYPPITEDDLRAVVRELGSRACKWLVIFNDFPGVLVLRDEMIKTGWVVGPQPVVWAKPRGAYVPNGTACSPAKSVEFLAVGRRKTVRDMKQRPGHYVSPSYSPAQKIFRTGGKPPHLMRAIVSDYSEPGDVVCDPFLGAGTTGVACRDLGRGFFGSECDRGTFETAKKRITAPYTPLLFPAGDR